MKKQWWEPEIYKPDDKWYNIMEPGFDGKYESEQWNFGCDHLEDAEASLRGMYKEVLKLRKQNAALVAAATAVIPLARNSVRGDCDLEVLDNLREAILATEVEHK